MYLGPFFFDTKEVFLVVAALLVGVAMAFGIDLVWFDTTALLTLIIILLITKGLLPAIHNEAFAILALAAVFLTLFLPLWQVLVFYFVSFLLFRVFKVI